MVGFFILKKIHIYIYISIYKSMKILIIFNYMIFFEACVSVKRYTLKKYILTMFI